MNKEAGFDFKGANSMSRLNCLRCGDFLIPGAPCHSCQNPDPERVKNFFDHSFEICLKLSLIVPIAILLQPILQDRLPSNSQPLTSCYLRICSVCGEVRESFQSSLLVSDELVHSLPSLLPAFIGLSVLPLFLLGVRLLLGVTLNKRSESGV